MFKSRLNAFVCKRKTGIVLLAWICGLGLAQVDSGNAQVFTNLHNLVFTNGTDPQAPLIVSGGVLFGTTTIYGGGNAGGSGSVFRLNTDGSGFTNLHTFSGGSDGGAIYGGLVLSGNTLFGPALFGGTNATGEIFSLNTDGTDLTDLYSFPTAGGTNEFPTNYAGTYPQAGLVLFGARLFGLAYSGGPDEWGTLFAVNTDGSGFTNLHSFNVTDGQNPTVPLTLSGGTLYGASSTGGANEVGTLFALSTNGTGFSNLYSFSQPPAYPYTNSDGANPLGPLLLSGNVLYGTASGGGTNGNGTVFKINTDGSGFSVLHQFSGTSGSLLTNMDGANPECGLVLFSNALYGTAMNGGAFGNGTIFRLSMDGSGFTTLYNFTSTNNAALTNSDGAHPVAGLVMSGGALYGTASQGGTNGYGTVFSVQIPPPLFITEAGTNVIISWPTNFTGFILQYATNLVPPVTWSTVSGQSPVTNSNTGKQRFYRLMRP